MSNLRTENRRAALDLLLSRRSAPALVEPTPTEDELRLILRTATTVPDHHLLRPWRFVVVQGGARTRFGEALLADLRLERPDSPPEALAKARAKAFVAPLFVVLIASPRDDGRTPEWEQVASAAAAGYAMLLAANALGLASGWKSAAHLDGPALRDLLSLRPSERVMGWINLGHYPERVAEALELNPRPVVDLGDVVTRLEG
jgi:nitroreductase